MLWALLGVSTIGRVFRDDKGNIERVRSHSALERGDRVLRLLTVKYVKAGWLLVQ